MIVILGLVILVAALVAGAAGVLANRGHAHAALLAQSRRETAAVSQHRDDLISQRDTARAYTVLDEQRNYTASTFGDGDGRPAPAATPAGPPMPPPAVTSF
jgi:hypothetical protein